MQEMMRPRDIVKRLNESGVGGMSEYSLYKLLKTGQIPARKPGRCYVVSYNAVLDWLHCADGHGDITPPQVAENKYNRPLSRF